MQAVRPLPVRFASRRRHTRLQGDWSSDVCSSDLGTERGLGKEPQPEFSTCFGSPFLPRDPSVYGNLLRDLIAKHGVDCWLVNTGWTGGKYGTGRRMPIKVTRALLTAALNGSLRNADFRTDKYFRFAGPTSLPRRQPPILH